MYSRVLSARASTCTMPVCARTTRVLAANASRARQLPALHPRTHHMVRMMHGMHMRHKLQRAARVATRNYSARAVAGCVCKRDALSVARPRAFSSPPYPERVTSAGPRAVTLPSPRNASCDRARCGQVGRTHTSTHSSCSTALVAPSRWLALVVPSCSTALIAPSSSGRRPSSHPALFVGLRCAPPARRPAGCALSFVGPSSRPLRRVTSALAAPPIRRPSSRPPARRPVGCALSFVGLRRRPSSRPPVGCASASGHPCGMWVLEHCVRRV